jgi:cytochrome c peroxidase
MLFLLATAAAGWLAAPALLQACGGDDLKPVGMELYFPLVYGDRPTQAELSQLGRQMFSDRGLSASGRLSCASCHSPASAYGSPNALHTQPGGPLMNRSGFRNTPSLTYVHSPIDFTEHFYENKVTGGQDDEGPTGGRTWDGRVNSGHEQALMPLLDPNEMANASPQDVLQRLRRAPYAAEFERIVSPPGQSVWDDEPAALGWMTVAIAAFEQSAPDFHPFTSKYDAYLRDQATLTAQEARGLQLFNDIKKGNCASCHPSGLTTATSRFPLFTDFGYIALAVPRNRQLQANADRNFFDLGLCGPLRSDLKDRPAFCGRFRTPSLRNVAQRPRFFHNGVFGSLREVVQFYVSRDITPQRWYPRKPDGTVDRYDDLPAQYRGNINTEPPFAPRPDGKPRLNEAEIDDMVAFLRTLSDGYTARPTRPR